MSADRSQPDKPKLLPAPGASAGAGAGAAAGTASGPAGAGIVTPSAGAAASLKAVAPATQMGDLPKPELDALAAEFGIDPAEHASRQHLVAAIHARRQLIASLERDAMVDVINWGGKVAGKSASKEQLAIEIVGIKSMRFGGLTHRGLYVLAKLRGAPVESDATEAKLIRELRRLEGFFSRMNRKRRAWLGAVVGGIIGDDDPEHPYADHALPPPRASASDAAVSDAKVSDATARGGDARGGNGPRAAPPGRATIPPAGPTRPTRIREEIEQSGLFGGLANRVKKSADSYVNQKLDEIEARIDRKLDEIDRRLAEWRDKEIANRIRILKINALGVGRCRGHFVGLRLPAGAVSGTIQVNGDAKVAVRRGKCNEMQRERCGAARAMQRERPPQIGLDSP